MVGEKGYYYLTKKKFLAFSKIYKFLNLRLAFMVNGFWNYRGVLQCHISTLYRCAPLALTSSDELRVEIITQFLVFLYLLGVYRNEYTFDDAVFIIISLWIYHILVFSVLKIHSRKLRFLHHSSQRLDWARRLFCVTGVTLISWSSSDSWSPPASQARHTAAPRVTVYGA